jgi:hypothetical protein
VRRSGSVHWRSAALVVAALVAAGCPGPGGGGGTTPAASRTAGLALTYYRQRNPDGTVERLVVVEQRRWVEVGADRTLEIDRIDDGADLATLVIEPLGGTLVLGRCGRDSVLQALRGAPAAWVGRVVEIEVAGGRTIAGTIVGVEDRHVVIAGPDGKTTVVRFEAWRALRVAGGDSVVRCAVAAGTGRQLVRVVHATTAFGFEAEHTIRARLGADDKGEVEIVARFTVETPPWQVPADVTIFDGLPGAARSPRQVFRGPITLSGDPVVVSGPTLTAPARIEAVYRADPNQLHGGDGPRDPGWRMGATFGDVHDWLELDIGDAPLPPGGMMVEVARAGEPPQLVTITDDALELPDPEAARPTPTRIRLWAAPDLKGGRNKVQVSSSSDNASLIESVVLSISNGGERPREVVVEEELRPHRKHLTVVRPFPKKPALRENLLRLRLTVPPGATRAGYILDYDF